MLFLYVGETMDLLWRLVDLVGAVSLDDGWLRDLVFWHFFFVQLRGVEGGASYKNLADPVRDGVIVALEAFKWTVTGDGQPIRGGEID